MSTTTRAVTFDVGGTLIEPWPSVGRVYADVAKEFGLDVAATDLDRIFSSVWRARRPFDYSREAWKKLVNRTFAELTATPPGDGCFDAIYQRFARAPAWRIFDDVWPALRRLKAQGLKAGVISNWDERLRPLLNELGLLDRFDVFVSSHETGNYKPAREIFERAAELLSLPPETILHVGDSEQEDVTGARAAGFQAAWLQRTSSSPRAISSLNALFTASEALRRHSTAD